ncbi:polysaccharide biosynthesis/export family protein [Flavihumibacter sp. UBA7668]|uniref:polysaccharide biosynthesis/export family protein n=1 Tax=Flavihumibacter sp. UBA7668 TaxID=1946542 RepID=UPI0025C74125|nr:polysaccharide biosynthesis/export family protein [Flavihumibacter sp. UBA7668]
MLKKLYLGAAMVTALFLLVACGASKKNHEQRVILQGIDTANIEALKVPDLIIQKGDLLTILVYSDNKEATEIYNQAQTGGSGAVAGNAGAAALTLMGRGYQVDNTGQIYFHSLGSLQVVGLTKKQVADQLTARLQTYLQNPYVIVRFTNARVTVMGEVLRPGMIEFPDQKISILDVIGLAGDLTPFARRDNVLIVREVDGKRITGRIDLRTADLYSSPFFYLQQNDFIYIEPNRKKPTGNEQVLMRNITIASSLVSVAALVITLIAR